MRSSQGPMAEPPSAASLFASPGSSKDTESAASPTSILGTKPFSAVRNPFFFDKFSPSSTTATEIKHIPQKLGDARAAGLGLVDALFNNHSFESASRPEQRAVVFGSQPKIQIPLPHSTNQPVPIPPPVSSGEALRSPKEFGVKNRSSQPAPRAVSMGCDVNHSSRLLAGCLPQWETELSEEYTCVILHGPNPKTTHIFDDCIIESCGDELAAQVSEKKSSDDRLGCSADDFLSFCYGCKEKLGAGDDAYIYRSVDNSKLICCYLL